MGCGVYYRQVNVLTGSLEKFGTWGVPETDAGYQGVWGRLKQLLSFIGRKLPRISITAKVTWGRSPGIFKLSVDPEIGFVVEARERLGAPPIYRAVSDDIARAIVKDELTLEQEKYLLTPDDYVGE